jgi:hypothetical protein
MDRKDIAFARKSGDYHHCPTPGCTNIVLCKSFVGMSDLAEHSNVDMPRICDCFKCGRTSCLSCGASPFHMNITCEEHKVLRRVLKDDQTCEVSALIPPVPDSFDKIDTMTMSELRQLLDDDAALDTFVQQTSEVSTLKELKQSIEQSNLIRRGTIEILHAEVESLQQDLQSKLQRYKQLDESMRGMTRP